MRLGELWGDREVAYSLARKDLQVRYKQTFFGVAWAIIQPLFGVLIFTVIFGRVARLPTDGIPYSVFAYAGLVIWLYYASAVSAAAQSLVDNRQLVAKVYFPRLLAPIAAVVPGIVDLAAALPILAGFMVVTSVAPGPQLVLLPLWIGAALVTALAVGLLLAGLNVRYRDVRFAMPFLLQVWLFASPVVYTASLLDGAWRYVYALNPMATIVTGFRWSIAGGPAPGAEAFVSAAIVLVLLLVGFVYFTRAERSFADVI
ncbi:MAG: ABC transporter permease [Actinomycetota bacterium]|nr:ABC transporter permease [Actinomycetota bacterium]